MSCSGFDAEAPRYWLRLKGYQAELAAEPVPEVVKSMDRAEVLAKHGRRQYVGGR